MLKCFLGPDERIDWFRVITDLARCGKTSIKLGHDLGIPSSTIRGWSLQVARPKAEDGIRVLAYWAYEMNTTVDMVPRIKAGSKDLRQTDRVHP